tara:strand:- start:944 stop:1261 length:318 start_codon:yes stop_codon:yes gene_type:complete
MKKIKHISILVLILASLMWSFNLVIGPVNSFIIAIFGWFLLLIYSIIKLFKGENRLETLTLLFGVLTLICFIYELAFGPIEGPEVLLITWAPLLTIHCILKLRGK